MKRRAFLKTSAALSATAAFGVPSSLTADSGGATGRDFYEWRTYRLRNASAQTLLTGYLERALIPALNRLGAKPVGAFTEEEPADGPAVHLLIPHPSLESFGRTAEALNHDSMYLEAGAAYLGVPKSSPAFDRMDSWLLLAFAGMPRLEQPAYSRAGKPRIFELRVYESHSELKAAKKVEMFNAGEIEVMKEVGLGPVFYGAGLVGRDLPHLAYMLSAEDMDSHKAHWNAFLKHPTWEKLKNDPQYKDTVSKITKRFLRPLPGSQL